MKVKIYAIKTGLFILGIILLSQSIDAQDWRIEPDLALQNKWDINMNAGANSFYGDISSYDNNFIGKLEHESGFATGVIVTKRFGDVFGLSGQVVAGKLEGHKNNISIRSSILEYNLHFRMDLIRLFTDNSKSRIKMDAFAGIGNFMFESTKEEFIEGEIITSYHKARVPEFVYLLGTGLSYDITEKISISSELSIKQCQNDKVDIVVAGVDYDYYSYLSIGITYHFRSLKRGPVRNKARIAHNDLFRK